VIRNLNTGERERLHCSTPAVDGDRLWYVTNRGEVVCLDTAGFADGEDDGAVQGVRQPVFEVSANLSLLTTAKEANGGDLRTLQRLVGMLEPAAAGSYSWQPRPGEIA
jgi:hypothetical protein